MKMKFTAINTSQYLPCIKVMDSAATFREEKKKGQSMIKLTCEIFQIAWLMSTSQNVTRSTHSDQIMSH